jgi:hypothetical protein
METQRPPAAPGMICPLHRKDMAEVCHCCPLWIKIRGKHPQSSAEIEEWNCALAWLPVLLIENAQMARQTGAAVESFRNEMVEINRVGLSMMQQGTRTPMIDGK